MSLDALIEPAADFYRKVEFGNFAIAEELADLKASGKWRAHAYPEGHPKEGQRPSTFRKFLEAYAEGLRERKLPLGAGDLEELVKLYEWAAPLGCDLPELAMLTRRGLKDLYRLYGKLPDDKAAEHLTNALVEVRDYGKFFLPADDTRPESPKPVLRLTQQADGWFVLKHLELWREGKVYRNLFPPELKNWLAKRLRARVEIDE